MAAIQAVGPYQLGEPLPDWGGRERFRAKKEGDREVLLTRIGVPEIVPEKRQRTLDRLRRQLSWYQNTALDIPLEILEHQEQLYLAAALPAAPVREAEVTLASAMSWMGAVLEVLILLHGSRQPTRLGKISLENLRLRADGALQLCGWELTPAMRFALCPFGEAPDPPEAEWDERSDLWSVGKCWEKLMEKASPEVRQEYLNQKKFRDLIRQMVDEDPSRRPASASVARSRLDSILRAVPEVGSLRLDLAEKRVAEATLQPWQRQAYGYQKVLLLTVLAAVTLLMLMNLFFPAH